MNKLILEKIKETNPGLARTIGEIMSQKIVKQIRCMSDKCQGRVIGYIDSNNKPVENGEGLLAIRTRFDGHIGVQCICGNDSRLSSHEKGIITAKKPTKEELNEIWERVNNKPTKFKQNSTSIEVDGFIIEDFK